MVEKVPLPAETKETLTCRKLSEDYANYFNIKSMKARFFFALRKWIGKVFVRKINLPLRGNEIVIYLSQDQQYSKYRKREEREVKTVLKASNTVLFLVTINLFKSIKTLTINIKLRKKN